MIIVNFKNYEEAFDKNSLKLAKICENIAKKYKANIIITPSILDLKEVSKKVKLPIFSQHIDYLEEENSTGSIIAKNLKKLNVKGSLINHSEKRLSYSEIKSCIEICKKYNLISVCCAENLKEVRKFSKLLPNYIAYEPPELIGGDISVSKAKPDIIKKAFEICRKNNVKLLVGAGIKEASDVKTSRTLGANGILVSSGIVKAKNKVEVLKKFVEADYLKGFFVGRFQPFHYGHLDAINQAFSIFDYLVIGIGSAQYSNTQRNPYSANLREKMIKAVLKNYENYEIVKIPDFSDDEKWSNYCLKNFDFDVVFTGSKHVEKCFKNKKPIIKIIFRKNRKYYRGRYIRKLIKEGNDEWKNFVPEAVVKIIS